MKDTFIKSTPISYDTTPEGLPRFLYGSITRLLCGLEHLTALKNSLVSLLNHAIIISNFLISASHYSGASTLSTDHSKNKAVSQNYAMRTSNRVVSGTKSKRGYPRIILHRDVMILDVLAQ